MMHPCPNQGDQVKKGQALAYVEQLGTHFVVEVRLWKESLPVCQQGCSKTQGKSRGLPNAATLCSLIAYEQLCAGDVMIVAPGSFGGCVAGSSGRRGRKDPPGGRRPSGVPADRV